MIALGGMPCATSDFGDWQSSKAQSAETSMKIPETQLLTRCEASFNASAFHCQHCGKPIPPHRVIAARRSKVEARWCSASCRVRGCVARKSGGT